MTKDNLGYEQAPRDKVGVDIKVVDSDPMQEQGGGTPAAEVTAERSIPFDSNTPLKTFPQELYQNRPSDMSEAQVLEADSLENEAVATQLEYTKQINAVIADSTIEYSEEELKADPAYQETSRHMAEFLGDQIKPMTTGLFDADTQTSAGTEGEQQAEYGMELYAELISNLGGVSMEQQRAGGLVPVLQQVIDSDDVDTMLGALYIMEMGDRKPMTLSGAGKAMKHMVGDLSNYIGIMAIPAITAKTVGKHVVSAQARQALRSAIQKKVAATGMKASTVTAAKVGGVAALEGGAITGTENLLRQQLEMGVGKREGIDLGEIAIDFGLGATIGAALGGALVKIPDAVQASIDAAETGAKKAKELYKWFYDEVQAIGEGAVTKAQKLEDDITIAVGGGIPPVDTSAFDKAMSATNRKEVQAYMRHATPEERPKLIEKMKSFEVGMNARFSSDFYAQITYFHNRLDDLITWAEGEQVVSNYGNV